MKQKKAKSILALHKKTFINYFKLNPFTAAGEFYSKNLRLSILDFLHRASDEHEI